MPHEIDIAPDQAWHTLDLSDAGMHVLDMPMPVVDLTTVGVLAPVITSNLQARVPVVTGIINTTAAAVKATASGRAYAPIVTGVLGASALVNALKASATGQAVAPGVAQTVFAVKASGTSKAFAPVIVLSGDAAVAAVKATASTVANPPVITVGVNGTVNAVVAASTSKAGLPGAPVHGTVNAVIARTNASIPDRAAPPIVSAETTLTGGGPAAASSIAIPPLTVGIAPQFEVVGGFASGANTSPMNIPVPAGVVNGSIVLVMVYMETNQAVTPPAGFTEAPNSPVVVTGANAHDLRVYWKRATTTDTGTYSFTSTWTWRSGIAARFSGCIGSGSPFDVTSSAIKTTITDGAITPVSVTTTGNNRLLVYMATENPDPASPGSACTPPAGFTERFDPAPADSFEIATKLQPLAGASGSLAGTFTDYPGATAAWVGALRAS